MSPRLVGLTLFALLLAGCDIPGLGPDPRVAQREADAKATGSACRYSLRGIEDCYAINPKASRSAVFAGWKEMDQYMRDNKVEGQASAIAQTPPPAAASTVDAETSIDKTTEKVVSPRKARAAPL